MKNITLITSLILTAFVGGSAQGVEIVGDNYQVTGSGSGFNLGSGVNSGINPPTTRLTGSAAAGLRYIKAFGNKADSAHTITGNKFQIARVATDSSTISFSSGIGTYDFGPVLNTLAASPAQPAVYDLKIDIANAAATNQRCSFAISSVAGTANAWDFAIQLFRTTITDTSYTVRKRVSAAAGGLGGPMNFDMTNNVGTYSNAVSFLIRVTDAGAEAGPSTNSRVQVSLDGGTSWIYDTSTDSVDLPIGWHFPSASRFIYFDAAGGAGPVTFDNFSLDYISGPAAGPKTWTGGGTNDNWSAGGNWGGVAPTTGDTLIFNGTTRQANINDIVDLIVPTVTFNNGGFSLAGNSFSVSGLITNRAGINTFSSELVWNSGAAKTWGITNGSEVVLNNITTVEVAGDHSIIGGGALRLKGTMNLGQATTVTPAFVINEGQHIIDAGTFNSRGGYRIGSLATGLGAKTILTNGATFLQTVAGGNLRVGDSTNPVTSRLEVNNSSLTMTGGNLGIPYAAGATGVVSQIGGLVSGGIVAFNDNGAGSGSYTIQNGILEPLQIREDFTNGSSLISFNNAILRPAVGANSAFFSGVDVAEIQAGGLAIDGTLDVTIAQPLSGVGSLVKSNVGIVTLTGANTYSGNTLVMGGKLNLPTVQTNATAVQVANGAELGVNVQSVGSTLSVSSLNFAPSSTLNFDLGTFNSPTAPLAKASSVSVSGPVTINVANGLQLSTGQFVLVDYNGAISGGFQFTLVGLPSGVIATLSNNVANSSIDLIITGVPGYVWTGATSSDWDLSTQNWISKQTGLPLAYADGFPTDFFDSASNGVVNLAISPSPSTITVSNVTLPYVWNSGKITTPIFKKFGVNSVTRVAGDNDEINSIELNAGSYVVSPSTDANFATVLSDIGVGTGTLVKQGGNTLTISTNNATYDGAILVQQGTLKLGNTNSPLGSTNGGTTIASGATLDLNDIVVPHEPVIVSGSGDEGIGAIIDTAGGGVANNLTDVTMVGDTTFGSASGVRWDLRVRGGTGIGPGLRGNGFNLTKVGLGSVSIACERDFGVNGPYWQMNLGDIFLNEGAVTFAASLSLGNPAKNIHIAAGATLGTYDLDATNPIVRAVFVTDGTITGGGNSTTDQNIFTGPVQATGVAHLRPLDAKLAFYGAIGGSGAVGVSATGAGALFINGVNTYPGDTTVTNGFFGGAGTVAGNLVMLGGTFAPGTNSGAIGTFNVNGNATLAGTTLMELNRNQSPNSDRLVVAGTLTKSGTLTVVLGAGAPAPQAGDIYQLFNKGGSGTFAPINLPDLSALPGGLAWDTSNLNVNGSITVTGAATPPTIGSVSKNGNNLVFSGTGGVEGNEYVVLTSTNIALPVVNWTPIATNVFGAGGSFSYTNAINPMTPQMFYLLQVP